MSKKRIRVHSIPKKSSTSLRIKRCKFKITILNFIFYIILGMHDGTQNFFGISRWYKEVIGRG